MARNLAPPWARGRQRVGGGSLRRSPGWIGVDIPGFMDRMALSVTPK